MITRKKNPENTRLKARAKSLQSKRDESRSIMINMMLVKPMIHENVEILKFRRTLKTLCLETVSALFQPQ